MYTGQDADGITLRQQLKIVLFWAPWIILSAHWKASNFFSITTYVIGNYRRLGSDGLTYDILLGMETGVNVVSDLALLNVLHVSVEHSTFSTRTLDFNHRLSGGRYLVHVVKSYTNL
ncbi:hypothetical protein V5799_004361 [Amblyomma americanum]|uniref:Uncharacterized protein n=1 Tax=Amblyomma americanum TaxID=6943 RepID=A0AAQ4D6C5_AMBAM